MCGIFCIFEDISNKKYNVEKHLLVKYELCKTYINRRGPDYQSVKTAHVTNHIFIFAASILWLQGNEITRQPLESENSIFLYNGDIFGGSLISSVLREKHGDTQLFHKALNDTNDIFHTLSNIQGPYSFIYLDKKFSKLFFGRDSYGRRSLLIGKSLEGIIIASVLCRNIQIDCIELPAVGIFSYDLHSKCLELIPWNFKHSNFIKKVEELENFLNTNISIKEQNKIYMHKQFCNPKEEDLLLFKQIRGMDFNDALYSVLDNENWRNNVQTLNCLLEIAVKERIAVQPNYCNICIIERSNCNHALTGVLFSGGVDCAILAVLADRFTNKNRPIDLLNVAFNSNAPDRLTGLSTFNELKRICPERTWNFIDIDVTEEELNLERTNHIADLIYPLNTILDDSLGCALWFAGKGKNKNYKSSCRVLLVGMGADELFGGYTKHRAAHKRGGWFALNQSLEEDWQNISYRNLARDDRVISDHGRQLRTPYLDENVVEFVRNLNCWERTCPSDYLPQGLGEKILLRSLACVLGLKNAASLKKRALQFGSRIANSKEHAHDISPRLQ